MIEGILLRAAAGSVTVFCLVAMVILTQIAIDSFKRRENDNQLGAIMITLTLLISMVGFVGLSFARAAITGVWPRPPLTARDTSV